MSSFVYVVPSTKYLYNHFPVSNIGCSLLTRYKGKVHFMTSFNFNHELKTNRYGSGNSAENFKTNHPFLANTLVVTPVMITPRYFTGAKVSGYTLHESKLKDTLAIALYTSQTPKYIMENIKYNDDSPFGYGMVPIMYDVEKNTVEDLFELTHVIDLILRGRKNK